MLGCKNQVVYSSTLTEYDQRRPITLVLYLTQVLKINLLGHLVSVIQLSISYIICIPSIIHLKLSSSRGFIKASVWATELCPYCASVSSSVMGTSWEAFYIYSSDWGTLDGFV